MRVLLAALCLAGTFGAQSEREEAAAAKLIAAEQLAMKGKYAEARAAYRRLSKKYPRTMAGRAAFARAQPSAYLGWADILRTGDSKNRVDVVVMGDGFTVDHQRSLESIARVVPKLFTRNRTLGEYLSYHNFVRAIVVSASAGLDAHGRDYDTALGGRESGAIQGQVTVDPRLVHKVLDELPAHDRVAIVYVKRGVLGTSVAGVATVGGRGDKTTVHEWGHAFARLGDEYAQTTGHRGEMHDGINVSASSDPARVPWRHWIDAKAPGIGVYQGAAGRERGAYKAVASGCVMESGEFFCRVCREAFVLAIYRRVDPIDGSKPAALPASEARISAAASQDFELSLMRPKSHGLEVRWWVLPEREAPQPRPGTGLTDRAQRGKLTPIAAKPSKVERSNRRGKSKFRLRTKGLAPGRYRVICRVRDHTRFAGDRLPWVLADPRGLCESERQWALSVGR